VDFPAVLIKIRLSPIALLATVGRATTKPVPVRCKPSTDVASRTNPATALSPAGAAAATVAVSTKNELDTTMEPEMMLILLRSRQILMATW
jgi:hypothetical protein